MLNQILKEVREKGVAVEDTQVLVNMAFRGESPQAQMQKWADENGLKWKSAHHTYPNGRTGQRIVFTLKKKKKP